VGAPLFLPWHRAYLHFFELAMQDRVPEVTLAWWDWSSPRSHADGIPPLYEGAGNPLAWQPIAKGFPRRRGVPAATSRDPDDPAELPTSGEVKGDPLPAELQRLLLAVGGPTAQQGPRLGRRGDGPSAYRRL
jgi:hypothetical protein